jgi:hypothetical protein
LNTGTAEKNRFARKILLRIPVAAETGPRAFPVHAESIGKNRYFAAAFVYGLRTFAEGVV